jgi:hypothetical protein
MHGYRFELFFQRWRLDATLKIVTQRKQACMAMAYENQCCSASTISARSSALYELYHEKHGGRLIVLFRRGKDLQIARESDFLIGLCSA